MRLVRCSMLRNQQRSQCIKAVQDKSRLIHEILSPRHMHRARPSKSMARSTCRDLRFDASVSTPGACRPAVACSATQSVRTATTAQARRSTSSRRRIRRVRLRRGRQREVRLPPCDPPALAMPLPSPVSRAPRTRTHHPPPRPHCTTPTGKKTTRDAWAWTLMTCGIDGCCEDAWIDNEQPSRSAMAQHIKRRHKEFTLGMSWASHFATLVPPSTTTPLQF